MTRKTEDKAKNYLLTKFNHTIYSFKNKGGSDQGFDLWLDKQGEASRKVELKATEHAYQKQSDLFQRLAFSAEIEKKLFENGESVIARVFMGSTPPQVFIINNTIFSNGAHLIAEARYVVRGKINYQNSITKL